MFITCQKCRIYKSFISKLCRRCRYKIDYAMMKKDKQDKILNYNYSGAFIIILILHLLNVWLLFFLVLCKCWCSEAVNHNLRLCSLAF